VGYIKSLQDEFGELTLDILGEELADLYEEIFDEGKRVAFQQIQGYAQYAIEETLQDFDEDEE
jgi:hypothetical protein